VKSKPLCLDSETGEIGPYDKTNKNQTIVANSGYSRARWQLDAHGFMRSAGNRLPTPEEKEQFYEDLKKHKPAPLSGNRLLTPQELEGIAHHAIYKKFRRYSKETVYDFENHVELGESLEQKRMLPSGFMLLPPQSWHPDVWTDITRMRTLNGLQYAKGKEQHLCLAEDSLVLTREHGYIAIQTISVGDHVLTHNGRWRPVTVVGETGISETIQIRAHGVGALTLTPEHKLWIRKSTWARERDGATYNGPEWAEAKDILGDYVNLRLPDCEPHPIQDRMHWWIVGRWLADGHWDGRGAAIISCGHHELEGLVRTLGERCGGVYDPGTAHQIRILDPKGTLKATLHECGSGASGKRFPAETSTLPVEQASALLEGYLSGDGHYRVEHGRWTLTTVSRALALGVAILAQRVHGSIASVYPGRPERVSEIEGREVECKQEWVCCFYLQGAERRKQPFILDDGAWKKVRSIQIAGERPTWNLRVEEDESYTAEGCVVKNCPMQFDIANRVIVQCSMEGEIVFDPFAGLGTVAYCAIPLKRRVISCELNAGYWKDSLTYTRAAEQKAQAPTLFDITEWSKPEGEEDEVPVEAEAE
jgi:hypothetical protein